MAKRQPESIIKAQIIEFLQLHKIFFWNNRSTGIWNPSQRVFMKLNGKGDIRGTSDLLGFYKGRFFAIEVKSEKGTVTPEQESFMQNVIRNGHIAFVARSIEDVERGLWL